eukprot:scaffold20628_cov31-Tisochrysis_lutea.AAC.5
MSKGAQIEPYPCCHASFPWRGPAPNSLRAIRPTKNHVGVAKSSSSGCGKSSEGLDAEAKD